VTTERESRGVPELPLTNNDVRLRGRLAAEPETRTLPSGDEICVFRVNVPREPGERVRVDSIDCATTNGRVRRSLARAVAGDEIAVSGQLRRRFWRSGSGLASRYEVAVTGLKLLSRRRSAASPARTPASA
jgi:single-strand DNA-binding protein